jgi:hypothetical protein
VRKSEASRFLKDEDYLTEVGVGKGSTDLEAFEFWQGEEFVQFGFQLRNFTTADGD